MIMAAELDLPGPTESSRPDTSLWSYEPGVVDTPMQTAVRSSSVAILPIVQLLKDLAAAGALVAPALPAREIADYMCKDGRPRWEERRFAP